MEAIICDRCEKVIGEKKAAEAVMTQMNLVTPWPPGTDPNHGAAAASNGKARTRKLTLCGDCGKMQEAFLGGKEDLRTVRQAVHPQTICDALASFILDGKPSMADLPLMAEAIIKVLPNGGVF